MAQKSDDLRFNKMKAVPGNTGQTAGPQTGCGQLFAV